MSVTRLLVVGLCLISAMFCSTNKSEAGFQFDIVGLNGTYAQGATGTFDIVFSASAPSSYTNAGGYTAAFDTNAGGTNQGLTFTSVTYVAPGSGGVNLTNTNFVASLNGAGTRFSGSNDNGASAFTINNGDILARVGFTVGISVPVNTVFSISTRLVPNTLVDFTTGVPPAGFTELGSGSFTVTAVPEPTSLGLAGIAFGAFAVRRWKQKRKTAAQV